MQREDFNPQLPISTASDHYNFLVYRGLAEIRTLHCNVIYLFIGLSLLLSWRLYQRRELCPLHLFIPKTLFNAWNVANKYLSN